MTSSGFPPGLPVLVSRARVILDDYQQLRGVAFDSPPTEEDMRFIRELVKWYSSRGVDIVNPG